MKNKLLNIVELSAFIHTGSVNKNAMIKGEVTQGPNGWYTPSIPSGGIAFIFNRIMEYKSRGDLVVVADRAPLVKRGVNPDYKTTRPFKHNVSIQKELAELILEQCGVQLFYKEGYEADDIVYTLAREYKNKYKGILIHTDDSDNYVCVDTNVACTPVRKGGKFVWMKNYEELARTNHKTIYNSVAFFNMLNGKAKDDVPKMHKYLQQKWEGIATPENYKHLGDTAWVLKQAREIGLDAVDQVLLAYPLIVEDLPPVEPLDLDENMLLQWARVVGNFKYSKVPISKEVQETVDMLLKDSNYNLNL